MAKPSQTALDRKFGSYYGIAETVSTLLYPHAEVVLHDIASGRIAKIWNSFSNRKSGDFSHVKGAPDIFGDQTIIGPYEKALVSGGRCKSMTTAIYDNNGRNIGFFCINLDISELDRAAASILNFTAARTKRPETIYRNDLQEHLNYLALDFSQSVNKPINCLDRDERAAFVAIVNEKGLFQARNAVPMIAKTLDISRGTVYNLLSEINSGQTMANDTVRPATRSRKR